MDWKECIIIDPEILTGKPVVRGTRLAVEFIVGLLAQGWSEADVVQNYPGLTREDFLACLSYAREILQDEHVYPMTVRPIAMNTFPLALQTKLTILRPTREARIVKDSE